MNWERAARLGTMSGMLALSACMMPYDGGSYEAPPAPVYSAVESPDEYRFIDRADSLWETIGDAPPDNAFAFEGAEPWAWELADGHRIVVEDAGDGMRSYYFAPGDEGPFLAVRPGMSFGFDGEAVAVVYGPDGGAMPREVGAAHLGEGVELYARGRLLLRAMLQKQWRAVDSQAWIDASPLLWSSFQIWDEGKRRHPGWGRHRDQWRDAEWRRRLEAERLRRRGLADAFRRWREGGFQGPPPGHWHKPGAGAGRPDRPDRPGGATPGARPPRQPGQWHRPGGAGRPPRPDAGQPAPSWPRGPRRPPKLDPTDSGTVAPDTPQTLPAPAPDRPRRPGWGGRPRPGRDGAAQPDGSVPPTPVPTPQAQPGRMPPRWTRPEGSRPGWRRPPPAADGAATPSPAPAPRRNWSADAPSPTPRRNWSPDAPRPQRSAPPSQPSSTSNAPAPRAAPPPAPRPAPSRPTTGYSPAGPKGSRVSRED